MTTTTPPTTGPHPTTATTSATATTTSATAATPTTAATSTWTDAAIAAVDATPAATDAIADAGTTTAATAAAIAAAGTSAWAGDPHGEVDHPVPDCPVEITLRALRGRWTTLVVRELFAGERTFGDLADALPALSDKVLSDRLAQLVVSDVVVRVREPGWPSRVRYSLTSRGHALRGVLDAMWAWGAAAT